MTRSFIMRCAALALGIALAVGGLEAPVRADADAPVVLIVLENHAYGPTDPHVNGDTKKYLVGNTVDAPYLNNTLIPSGTLFTNSYATHHPSLPDYLELTAGTTGGCAVDSCPRDSIPSENLFHLLGEAGTSFTSFAESMPANCALANTPPYLVRHNPETYFTNLDAGTGLPYSCPNTDVAIAPAVTPGTPLAWPNPLPAFSFITPNYCNDMHGSPATGPCPNATDQIITDGDTWLGANVPALLAEGAIVIVTVDEGANGDATGGGGHVATVMAGPNVGVGATDATLYNHLSVLAGLEDYFNLSPLLGDAATATPLPIPRTTPYPTPTVSGFTPGTGGVGTPVRIAGTDLKNAYSVRFGGTPALFSVDSDLQIMASVPVGAVTGPVTVSTIGGTATSPDTFTVLQGAPAPAVVQHVVGSGMKSTQTSATWAQTTVAGDLLVATVGWAGSGTLTAPAGWTLAVSAGATAIYYRENAPPVSGSLTFSLSVKGNSVLSLSEWSGVVTSGALDRTAHSSSGVTSNTTAASGTTAVTSQPIEVSIAGIKAVANVSESGATNGFALLDQRSVAPNVTLGIFDFVSTAAAATRSTSIALSANAKWRGVIATFRGA
jgi:hypothetical protein